mmetsp:Transcript_17794/g.59616  ORF Transcript_17794/g.59616 Transcript_17794/m.59616 type:complete len:249 (-) Transcript_17794:99-845(-)
MRCDADGATPTGDWLVTRAAAADPGVAPSLGCGDSPPPLASAWTLPPTPPFAPGPLSEPSPSLAPGPLQPCTALLVGADTQAWDFCCRRRLLRIAEFQRFLMALSVRPGRSLTIWDHLVPTLLTMSRMSLSSSSVQWSLRTAGLRWLCHRSRHCFPTRSVPSCAAIVDHFLGPKWATSSARRSSSSFVQAFFLLPSSSGSGAIMTRCGWCRTPCWRVSCCTCSSPPRCVAWPSGANTICCAISCGISA